VTITAAGKAHLEAIEAERAEHAAQAHADRLADDIARVAMGDIAWSATKTREGQARGGLVVRVVYDRDSDPQRPEIDKLVVVEYGSDEPCDTCGGIGNRRTRSWILEIWADDICDLSPRSSTGMEGWARRLCRLAADRGLDRNGLAYLDWAQQLTIEAGLRPGRRGR
jgi:hypothetical protein